jgi:Flp pilus assembly protein TadG
VERRCGGSCAERGQTLVLIVVFMMSLLGMAAMAIDVGSWYQTKRHLQADVDAAALAAAASIPLGPSSATTVATAEFNKNKISSSETAAITTPTVDSIQVVATYPAPTFFAHLFGKNTATIKATATATIQAAGSVRHHVSPYVVTRATYNNGHGTTLFSCDASGNCGTVDLPTASNTTGGSCSGSVYTGITGNIKSDLADQLDIGNVNIGGCLSPKTGDTQPSGNTINNLPGSFSQDLQNLGNGNYQVSPQSWDDSQGLPPRLIYVPIVESFANGTNANVIITGLAWFYMTSATGSGQGLRINGQYISVSGAPPGSTVAWNPNATGQITSVALTG